MHIIVHVKGSTVYAGQLNIPYSQVLSPDGDMARLTFERWSPVQWSSRSAFRMALQESSSSRFVLTEDDLTRGAVYTLHPERPLSGRSILFLRHMPLTLEQLLRLSALVPEEMMRISPELFQVEALAEHFSPSVGLEQSSSQVY